MHASQTLQVVLSEQSDVFLPSNLLTTFVSCTFCFCAHASTPAGRLCLCEPLFCCPRPCTCPPPFFQPNSSSLIHLVLTHTSPFSHFFCVFFHRAAWLSFHLFSRPSFLVTCVHAHLLLRYFLHDFHLQGNSFNPSSFQTLLHLLTLGPLHFQLVVLSASHPLPPLFRFRFASRATLCPPVLCAVALASSCAIAFSLAPAATSLSDFIPIFSFLTVLA